MRTTNGDYEIEFETFGRRGDPTLLLVNGLGSQMIAYRDALCLGFATAGFHVVRYDNRDVGLSTKTPTPPPSISQVAEALAAGEPAPVAYSVADMAADGMAVLDAARARTGFTELYARVDLLSGEDGSPVLLELELCEPSFFLTSSPGSAARAAEAIAAAVRR